MQYSIMASNRQEEGYEKRLDELALPGDELQTPVKERLEKLLRHSNMTWDEVDSFGQESQDHTASDSSAFPWTEILPKLRKRQKKSKKHVHGRMTCTVDQPHSRMKTPSRSVTSCPGRRHSRPVGSCWAGKGACLQDFHSNNLETRGRGSQE